MNGGKNERMKEEKKGGRKEGRERKINEWREGRTIEGREGGKND